MHKLWTSLKLCIKYDRTRKKKGKSECEKTNKPVDWLNFILDRRMTGEKTKHVDEWECMSNGLLSNFVLSMTERARKKGKSECEKTNKPVDWLNFILDSRMTAKKTNDVDPGECISYELFSNFVLSMTERARKKWIIEREKMNKPVGCLSFILDRRMTAEKKRLRWMRKNESAEALPHFALNIKQTRHVRFRYKKLYIDSADSTMILFLEDDIVMKRLFG